MTLSDILRNIADKLAAVEQGDTDSSNLGDHVGGVSKNFQAMQAPETQDSDVEKDIPLDTMVPPLQQKIELLKRSVGIDNVFDGSPIDKTDDGSTEELDAIKRMAGISPNTTAIMTLSDDEPMDN